MFFPLLFKVLAWGGSELDSAFEELLPRLLVPSSFIPLFHAILDLPALVLALEDFERGSGYRPGMAPAGTVKSPAPEALLALMDVAYTGSISADDGSGAGNVTAAGSLEARSAFFTELLRDENEGLVEQHWSHPGMAIGLKAAASHSKSGRLKHACDVAPSLLMIYFQTAIQHVSQALLCALLPMIFARIVTLFPDESFRSKVHHLCIDTVLTVFGRMPELICVLRKPIINAIGQPYTSAAKD
ncbi:hypothetical protein CBR_g57499 [Chara braunii]|uniref:AP-5 complex subunit zeta-1 C-terminal TPR domain-containing protein n=1 Tax=Chara braunii TaxID=69332 RepID=A0A388MEC7_CHABU|nr:hypothetical protein CBR_g57499 [Chara braunii]|eukprot:GBG92842.1 hypothetical protein CBR_g57499 [Chara braunii]